VQFAKFDAIKADNQWQSKDKGINKGQTTVFPYAYGQNLSPSNEGLFSSWLGDY